jgi:hypothetical protein
MEINVRCIKQRGQSKERRKMEIKERRQMERMKVIGRKERKKQRKKERNKQTNKQTHTHKQRAHSLVFVGQHTFSKAETLKQCESITLYRLHPTQRVPSELISLAPLSILLFQLLNNRDSFHAV